MPHTKPTRCLDGWAAAPDEDRIDDREPLIAGTAAADATSNSAKPRLEKRHHVAKHPASDAVRIEKAHIGVAIDQDAGAVFVPLQQAQC